MIEVVLRSGARELARRRTKAVKLDCERLLLLGSDGLFSEDLCHYEEDKGSFRAQDTFVVPEIVSVDGELQVVMGDEDQYYDGDGVDDVAQGYRFSLVKSGRHTNLSLNRLPGGEEAFFRAPRVIALDPPMWVHATTQVRCTRLLIAELSYFMPELVPVRPGVRSRVSSLAERAS